jgi:hypothetical protein
MQTRRPMDYASDGLLESLDKKRGPPRGAAL